MLEIQRDKDRERARLIVEEGLSPEAASAALNDGKKFRPAFPKTSAVMMNKYASEGSSTSLYERMRAFHAASGR